MSLSRRTTKILFLTPLVFVLFLTPLLLVLLFPPVLVTLQYLLLFLFLLLGALRAASHRNIFSKGRPGRYRLPQEKEANPPD